MLVSLSVGLSARFLSKHVSGGYQTWKRGYVGMCNGRSAQQESGAVLSKNSLFTGGG